MITWVSITVGEPSLCLEALDRRFRAMLFLAFFLVVNAYFRMNRKFEAIQLHLGALGLALVVSRIVPVRVEVTLSLLVQHFCYRFIV